MSFLSKLEGDLVASLKYFPYVLNGAIAIQSAMPNVPGTNKKQILLSGLAAGAAIGETIPEVHVQAVSAMIDAVVSALKSSSLFGFSPTAQTTQVPQTLAPARQG
jgi:hypothetical protein